MSSQGMEDQNEERQMVEVTETMAELVTETQGEKEMGNRRAGRKRVQAGKKKSKTKIVITIVVVAALILIIILGSVISNISKGMQEAMENMTSDSEDIFEVVKKDVEQEITTSGMVIGTLKNAYTSPVTAKVEDVKVEVGQIVRKGDVLLTYDASELGDNLAKVKIQAQSERAAGNESFEAANKAAGKASEAKKKIKSLKSDIKDLKKKISSLSNQVEAYENQMKAAEDGATSKDEESGDSTAAGTVDSKAYKKAVSELKKKNETLAAKQSELAEQESIAAANEDVTVSESTKAQISASNQLSDMNIDDAQESLNAAEAGITAAFDGIVESIDIVKGAYANETQTLITIIDSECIGVEFSISKDDLGSITKGQKARVVIAGNEYEGTIDYVSRVAVADMSMTGNNTSSGGTIKGRILIENPDDNIYIGVSAKAYIFVGKSEKTLVIPYEALNTDIDGDFVYVVNKENLVERKNVTVGIYSDEYYEVLDGVQEGDKVITNVTKEMKPGDLYVNTAGMATP